MECMNTEQRITERQCAHGSASGRHARDGVTAYGDETHNGSPRGASGDASHGDASSGHAHDVDAAYDDHSPMLMVMRHVMDHHMVRVMMFYMVVPQVDMAMMVMLPMVMRHVMDHHMVPVVMLLMVMRHVMDHHMVSVV